MRTMRQRRRSEATSLTGVINLDMIGYESVPPNDHIVEVHAGVNPALDCSGDVLVRNIAEYGLQLIPQTITSGATTRSDHASFWNQGYPAILGIEDFQDFNPYYHSPNDTLANMETPLMVEYTKACVATLAELAAGAPTASSSIYLPYFGSAPVSAATP